MSDPMEESGFMEMNSLLNIALERTEKNVKDPTDIYSEVGYFPRVHLAYDFQHDMARRCGGKVLNAACANDPAKLGEPPVNATNLDIQTVEESTKLDFSANKNYINASVFSMPFEDSSYDTIVLGEFLEHCTEERAEAAIAECRRVLKPGGHLIMTIPLDGRHKDEQRNYNGEWKDVEYCQGVTTYHQTWWTSKMLYDLRKKTKLVEVGRAPLFYMLTCPLTGLGLVWRKP